MTAVAHAADVPDFGKKMVTVEGRDILLVQVKGKFYAVENDCPHQGSPMNAAIVKEGFISCPRHGYRFSLTDGSCAEHPELTLKVFPLHREGDELFVTLS